MKGVFTFLGTGSSTGVPIIGCSCSVCLSTHPHNNRLRSSAFLQVMDKSFVIDAGPDFRQQALRAHIKHLDGVMLTHTHFDHVAGIDELRVFYFSQKHMLPILLSTPSLEALKKRYDYLFEEQSFGVSLTAKLAFKPLMDKKGQTQFEGLDIRYVTYAQGGVPVTGFIIGDMAYVTDLKDVPDSLIDDLKGVKSLVLNALRQTPSYMHLSLDEAVDFAQKVGVQRAYFTHIGHEMDQTCTQHLPAGYQLAYDGLQFEFNLN